MLIQLANIIGGVLLSAAFISQRLANKSADDTIRRIQLYEAEIGVGVLICGILALIERLGIFFFNIKLGSSFPQAIPAILVGIILGYPLLRQFGFLDGVVRALTPHRTLIGIIAFLCGLGSLLFGCISPIGCPGGALYINI